VRKIAVELIAYLAIVVVSLVSVPEALSAQYFGRNKVQYDHLSFRVLETPHFRIHYYPVAEEAVQDAARMAERWYERNARLFQHDFLDKKPLVLYADHPDFQQTNTLEGFIPEGTGGVTESLKDRVIMPLANSYASTDHVLGHELVHAFQFDLAKAQVGDRGRSVGGGVPGLIALPLWLIEGMAEYLSVGPDDPHTAMWLRDAILRDDFPTITEMTRESRFFPYRFGQALWAYIGGTYGDDAVLNLFRRSLRQGFEGAVASLLQIDPDTLSAEWSRAVADSYLPLMEGKLDPENVGTLLLAPSTGSGTLNIAPALSPDGRWLAFLSERDLFTIDLFLADARTGRVIRKLSSSASDTHFDALAYTETAGSFSPDGASFAFVVFGDGDNEIVVVDVGEGDVERRIELAGIGSLEGPVWSPDGRSLAFSGTVGGVSDLFVYELEGGEVQQLTRDRNADFHPVWSPDGRTIAFASDRGPETDFDLLTFSEPRIALLDVTTRDVRVLELFGNVRHTNPQFSPDGQSLYFISDRDGFADIYRTRLASGDVERVTSIKTGVTGITSRSPALSVAARSGDLAFSVFDEFEFHIYALPANPAGSVVARSTERELHGRLLPPDPPYEQSRVAAYLADPNVGLQSADSFPVSSAEPYRASLTLDRLGQPYLSAGSGAYGYTVNAGASAFFSDMLGNRYLAVAVQQTGGIKDLGAQAIYANFARRWNWALQGGRIPFRASYQMLGYTPEGNPYLGVLLVRTTETGALGRVAYPLSVTRRLEGGAGMLRYNFDLEEHRYYLDPEFFFFTGERGLRVIREKCGDVTEDVQLQGLCVPDPLNMAQLQLAYVGDNSFFGFTSPIRGGRFRFGMEATLGSENFLSLLLDWRRYYSPHQNLVFAMRGLHLGRYGAIGSDVIRPMYLNETYVRGYAIESIQPEECSLGRDEEGDSTCPTFSRLMGHRLGIANVEVRVPLFGVEQYGLIDFRWFPTELVGFFDGGVAWDSQNPAQFTFRRNSVDRVPVFSAGIAARFNILGAMILEAYRAFPFQRPEKGAHWGFILSPGW
jgi:Tol biopolymer transport system component